MDEQPTCGKGLADNATLPARLGELTSALGSILEAHIPSLDLTDDHSRREREVYQDLAEELRRAGLRLETIARQMAGSRDLPMGRHEEAAMASPAVQHAFQRFVLLEQELLTMLQRRLEQDRHMLAAMRPSGH
jgi:hypothetical protein